MSGKLEVITGPMFSGKTEELLRRIRRVILARQKVIAFKPSIDARYGEQESIVSHNLVKFPAFAIPPDISLEKFLSLPEIENTPVIAFDEAQFFKGLPEIARELVKQGKRVIVAGLDLNFRGEPFGSIPHLLALADEVIKLTAICEICGSPATKTQRLFRGIPMNVGPEIIIGGKEGEISYIPVCNVHFQWPK